MLKSVRFEARKAGRDVEFIPSISLEDLRSRLNEVKVSAHIEFGILKNGSIQFIKDSGLSKVELPNDFFVIEVSPKIEKHVETYNAGEISFSEEYKVHSFITNSKINHTLKFFDIDQNGKQDILICDSMPNANDFSFNLKGKYGQFKQNPHVKYYYDLLQGNLNPTGTEQMLKYFYSLVSDRKLINAKWVSGKNDEIYDSQAVFEKQIGTYKLIKNTNYSFPCHDFSIPIDANKDGFTDLLTGNNLVMLGKDGKSLNIKLSTEDLKSYIKMPRNDLKISDHPVELVSLYNDGILEFIESFGTLVDKNDRSLVVARENSIVKFYRGSRVKLLTKDFSPFGGFTKIQYKHQNGAHLVDNILIDNLTAFKNKKVYTYEGLKIDEDTNILIGHKKVQEKTYRNDSLLGTTDHIYYQDFNLPPLFYLTRARNHGNILKIEKRDNKGELLFKNQFDFNYLNMGPTFRTLFAKVKSNQFKSGEGEISTRYEYANPFLGLFFKETKVLQQNSESSEIQEFNLESYTRVKSKKMIKDLSTSKREEVIYVSNSDGKLIKSIQGKKVENFGYDHLGRLNFESNQRNKSHKYIYYGSSPLLKSESSDLGTVFYDYYFVTNELLSKVDLDKNEFQYFWSPQGFVSKITKNSHPIFQQDLNERRNQLSIADENYEFIVDGFGEVLNLFKLQSDGTKAQLIVQQRDAIGEILSKSFLTDNEMDFFKEKISTDFLNRKTRSVFELRGQRLSSLVDQYEFSQNLTKEMISLSALNDRSKTVEYLKNERGLIEEARFGSENFYENTKFNYDFKNQLVNVSELNSMFGANFSYNEFGEVNSSEANSQFFWGKNWVLNNLESGIKDSNSGMVQFDQFDREVFQKNKSNRSLFEENSSYVQNNLAKNIKNFNSLELSSSFSFSNGLLTAKNLNLADLGFLHKYAYDQFGRILQEEVKSSKFQMNLSQEYFDGEVSKIEGLVDEVAYTKRGNIDTVFFANGSSLILTKDAFGRFKSSSFVLSNGQEYSIEMDKDSHELSRVYSNKWFNGFKQKAQSYAYNSNLSLSSAPLFKKQIHQKRIGSSLVEYGDFKFDFENDLLAEVKNTKSNHSFLTFFDAHHRWQGITSKDQKDKFIKISSDEYLVGDDYVRAVRIKDTMVGVLINDLFYPVLTDQVGSVIAMFSSDGSRILFEREYSAWGEKLQVYGDKNLERRIPFAFAGLIQDPYMNGEMLFSETRVYLPKIGEWIQADHLVKWNPQCLISSPGNWNPIAYAANDPVNYVDPSGKSVDSKLSIGDGVSSSGRGASLRDIYQFNNSLSLTDARKLDRNMFLINQVALGGFALGGLVMSAPTLIYAAKVGLVAGTLEFNAARIGIGMMVAKDPKKIETIISNSSSLVDFAFFEGKGSDLTFPKNYVELIGSLKDIFE